MKRLGALTCVAVTLFSAFVLTVRLAAQEQPQKAIKTHYTVQDLGTLGGTFSWAFGINNKGSITGYATLPGDTAYRTFLWREGVMTDLGTLGGPNSGTYGGINERDEIAGLAETAAPDPFGEDFCHLGTYLTCAPSLWRNGVITELPTLGGNNGNAISINNRSWAVGGVENSTPDDCGAQLFQVMPVLWKNGQIEELPILSSDTRGYAYGINDHGQAVGSSRTCTVRHAVLWENGTVTDLGGLGGNFSVASGINNQGKVFGISYLSDDLISHAFLWQRKTGMMDLSTLPGDFYSSALGIDNKGRVVGTSCDESGNCRAFVWQNGVMTDLNTLIPAGSPWFLWEADSINSHGEIVGAAVNMTTFEFRAFLATPKASGAASDSLTMQSDNRAKPTMVLPENVRQLLQQRKSGRLGVGR